MQYICECGRSFDRPNSFNGHKSHCKIHFQAVGKEDIRELNKEVISSKTSASLKARNANKKEALSQLWMSEQHRCEKCGIIMTEKYGKGRFCSKPCANSRPCSEEKRKKISESVKTTVLDPEFKSTRKDRYIKKKVDPYLAASSVCCICNCTLPYPKRRNKTCGSPDCLTQIKRNNGLKSAAIQANKRRSKNEISFFNKCSQFFNQVTHNQPIFNGWDADVIIEDYKIAVLWNGIWHHEKITRNHSVEQVQNRDRIKISNIKACGYTPYVIDDLGIENEDLVNSEFIKLIQYIDAEVPKG